MRKRLLATTLVLVMVIWLGGCGTKIELEQKADSSSMFVILEETNTWGVVYHKETKVMYAVSRGDSYGIFAPLYNADGTLQVYEGGE